MLKLKYNFLFLVLSWVILFYACSRKADGDEEIKAMIVGTWKARVKNTTFRDEYHVMEFTDDGRYRELDYEDGGFGDDDVGWNSADTAGFKGYDLYIAFGDSVYYEIQNEEIYLQGIHRIQNGRTLNLIWVKPNKLKIEDKNGKFKYEKI